MKCTRCGEREAFEGNLCAHCQLLVWAVLGSGFRKLGEEEGKEEGAANKAKDEVEGGAPEDE